MCNEASPINLVVVLIQKQKRHHGVCGNFFSLIFFFQVQELEKEIILLIKLRHPNIVRLLDFHRFFSSFFFFGFSQSIFFFVMVKRHETHLDVFMELVSCNSLDHLKKNLQKNQDTLGLHERKMPEALIAVYMKQVLSALIFCHSKGVIHRGIVVVILFGSSND